MNHNFSQLLKFINEKTGLFFENDRIDFFKAKVDNRMSELKLSEYFEYLNYLLIKDINGNEINSLTTSLTVNETFFFRHPVHFNIINNILLKEICERNRNLNKPDNTLKIWSSGCSNGSEIYSIAILIFELLAYIKNIGLFNNIELIGTDIDDDILQKAREGVYFERCVKTEMNQKYLDLYFEKVKNGRYKIKNEIKKMVSFKKLNLVNDNYPDDVDILLCRNVLYYFDKKNQNIIIHKIYNALKNNGTVFVGGTETITYPEYFEKLVNRDAFYYKKWTTDRRIKPVNLIKINKRTKQPKEWTEPKIDIDRENSILILNGVFSENSNIKKIDFNINIFFKSLKKKFLSNQSLFGNYLKLDCSRIRWISNYMIYELKKCLYSIKTNNVIIIINCGDNENIYNWFLKSNLNYLANIEKIVRINHPITRPVIKHAFEINAETATSENLKTNINNTSVNNITSSLSKNKRVKLVILKSDSNELQNLKYELDKCMKNKTEIEICLRNAVYLSGEVFQIIKHAKNNINNEFLIEVLE